MRNILAIMLFACVCFLYAQDDVQTQPLEETKEQTTVETPSYEQNDDGGALRSLLSANKLTWDITSIATFENGRIVKLNLNNPVTGKEGITKLTPDIGGLTELTVLTMNDNDLTELPIEITKCTKLIQLEIQYNALTSLPPGISRLANLKVLDLRNNEFEALPAEICRLPAIEKLQLWGNKFVSLPDEISDLSTLKELYLKGNRLTNLPASIVKLRLKYIDVVDNKLCNLNAPLDAWLKKFDEKYKGLQKCVGEKRFK